MLASHVVGHVGFVIESNPANAFVAIEAHVLREFPAAPLAYVSFSFFMTSHQVSLFYSQSIKKSRLKIGDF